MIKYTNEQLEANYHKFIDKITVSFTGERQKLLLHMYSLEELGPNLILSPASGNIGYHNAYDGGYIDHIMNVVNNSLKVMTFYESIGGIIKFTKEELLFSAFHHDLGKLGTKGNMHYLHNPSDWHVKNQGKLYVSNADISNMTHTDRSFFLLNEYGIKYNETEYFGIKLTDGMYDEDNVKYLKVWDPKKKVKNNVHHILHWADHMSSAIEAEDNYK